MFWKSKRQNLFRLWRFFRYDYRQENKAKLLKNGFSKSISKFQTAVIPNLGKFTTIFFTSVGEYGTSYILSDGELVGFKDPTLNNRNIKELTSEEYDKVVLQFKENYIYLHNKIEDKLKAGGFLPKIYPVFLKMNSVNSKDFKGRPFVFQNGDTKELVNQRKSIGAAFEVADLVENAVKLKLDGAIIKNIADPNVSTNYAVFKANQIKSVFNEGQYSPENDNFYNQLINDTIIGQANIKALTVLIDAIKQKQDTLPHEYAHHYIAWYRDTPIVQEAIKKWGSEEALVQSIGEQVVKQQGEAYNWWKNFVKWIMDKFNSLSKLQKEELTKILTDAFLTRQDLSKSIGTSNTTIPSERQQQIEELFKDNPELANAVYSSIGLNMINESEITYTDEEGNPCAKNGMRNSNFTKGSTWKIVQDLKGYPSHAQGGVDIKLGKDGFSFSKNNTIIKAEHGLVLPIN